MKNLLSILLSLKLICVIGCNDRYKITRLREEEGDKITYFASYKYGYRIEVEKENGEHKFHYVLNLSENGRILSVIKFPIEIEKAKNIIKIENKQFLISDTTDNEIGAKLFGEEIIGYYDTKNVNYIMLNNFKGNGVPLEDNELLMFEEVNQLSKKHHINYIPFKISGELLWFKYELN